jgi:hypothetical protein
MGHRERLLEGAKVCLAKTGFRGTTARAILATGTVLRGLAWAALGVAVVNVAFVPSMFSGTDPAQFYSINGWHLPILGSMFMAWILTASVILIRHDSDSPQSTASS